MEKTWKGKKRKIIDALIDPENIEKTDTEICKIVGISRTYYYKAFADPDFRQAVLDTGIRLYARHFPQIANRVMMTARTAKKGDDKAIRLIHEALQLAGSKVNQTVNIANQVEQAPMPTDPRELYNELVALRDEINEQIQQLEQAGHGIHSRNRVSGGEE